MAGERAAHESQVRGFEDLEAGRKTQEGYEAGERRLGERLERNARAIRESAQKTGEDLKAGYWEAARVDAASGAAAEQVFGKASEELQSFRRDYWAGDAVGKGGGGTETEAGKTMAGAQQTEVNAEKSTKAKNSL